MALQATCGEVDGFSHDRSTSEPSCPCETNWSHAHARSWMIEMACGRAGQGRASRPSSEMTYPSISSDSTNGGFTVHAYGKMRVCASVEREIGLFWGYNHGQVGHRRRWKSLLSFVRLE